MIETLLATLDLDDYGISLSLPLDLDINGIVNSLLAVICSVRFLLSSWQVLR